MNIMPTGPQSTNDVAYFCPQCGSPALEHSKLAGGDASCKNCPWKGKSDDLHAVPFSHAFANGEEGLARFIGEVSNTIAANVGESLGRLLLKWGFIKPEVVASEFPVYAKAIVAAAVRAILETREGLATGKIPRHPKKPEGQRRGIH